MRPFGPRYGWGAALADGLRGGAPLALLAIALRALYVSPYLEEWDSVDFALAIHRYSLTEFLPHFPGYPVFLWLAGIAWRIFGDDTRALTFTSAVLGGLTVVPLYVLALRMLGPREALVAGLLLGVHPFHWLVSEKPLSDAAGTFFVVLFLALAWLALEEREKRGWIPFSLASVALGLALGVRLSYFPFGVPWLFVLWRLRSSWGWRQVIGPVLALAGTVGLWLEWQVAQEGLPLFVQEALRFTRGHFADWGGTLITDPDPAGRPLRLLQGLLGYGLGLYAFRDTTTKVIFSVLLGMAILLGFRPNLRRAIAIGWREPRVAFLLAATAPYLIWIALGQNLDKGRHFLPLVPLLLLPVSRGLIHAGAGLRRGWGPLLLSILFVFPLATGAWWAVRQEREHKPVVLQLIEFVRARYPLGETLLLTGEEKRLFTYYAPEVNVLRIRSGEEIIPALQTLAIVPRTILVTSTVLHGAEPARFGLRAVKVFSGGSTLHPGLGRVTLYELQVSASSRSA